MGIDDMRDWRAETMAQLEANDAWETRRRMARERMRIAQQAWRAEHDFTPYSAVNASSASCACTAAFPDTEYHSLGYGPAKTETLEEREERRKKEKHAENKAILLFQNLQGVRECDVYRKTRRVVVSNRWVWVIGDVFKYFDPESPFDGKPDVVRVDNPRKGHYTSFCVDPLSREAMPFTDKVIAYATHCADDERAFYKMANRMREGTFEKLPECAHWK